jgi:hypothetical protein
MKYRRKEIVDAIQFNEENPQVEVKQMLYFSEIIVTGNIVVKLKMVHTWTLTKMDGAV